MDSGTKKSSFEFLPALESARGVAALLIVFFHYSYYEENQTGDGHLHYWVRNFDLAVPFFFILSGFIMTKIYFEKINDQKDLFGFLSLRFGRIYPLHLFWILLYLVRILITQRNEITLEQENIFWRTFFLVNPRDSQTLFNPPSWSISAEFISYILFGFHIFVLNKCSKVTKSITVLLVFIISFYLLYIEPSKLGETPRGFLRGIFGFYLGALGYLFFSGFKLPKYTGYIFLIIGIFIFLRPSEGTIVDSIFPLLAIIGVVWLAKEEVQKTILGHPLLVWLGTVSYSVYLGHHFVGLIINRIIEKCISFPINKYQFYSILVFKIVIAYFLAHLTYKFIENPFRKLARNWVGRWS